MSEDMIFEMAVNASKAKAFDVIADQNLKLQKEINRLQKIIDTHLEKCCECNGTGEKEKTLRVGQQGMEIEMDAPCTCIFCEGTGKVPKYN